MCVPLAPVFVCAEEEYLHAYIYIYMLPHDQKRQMNMVDFFGGYQVTIEIMYMRSLFCIM